MDDGVFALGDAPFYLSVVGVHWQGSPSVVGISLLSQVPGLLHRRTEGSSPLQRTRTATSEHLPEPAHQGAARRTGHGLLRAVPGDADGRGVGGPPFRDGQRDQARNQMNQLPSRSGALSPRAVADLEGPLALRIRARSPAHAGCASRPPAGEASSRVAGRVERCRARDALRPPIDTHHLAI